MDGLKTTLEDMMSYRSHLVQSVKNARFAIEGSLRMIEYLDEVIDQEKRKLKKKR